MVGLSESVARLPPLVLALVLGLGRSVAVVGWFATHPAERVTGYEVEWHHAGPAATEGGGAGEEALAALEALGYLEDGTPVADAAAPRAALARIDFWEVEPRLVRRALAGELSHHLLQGRRPEARELLELVARRAPGLLAGVVAHSRNEVRLLEEKLGGGVFPPGAVGWLERVAGEVAGQSAPGSTPPATPPARPPGSRSGRSPAG